MVMNIAKRIDELLSNKHISGYKMCADLGMSRSVMTELRKERTKTLTTDTARKIADYLGVSVDYLLGKEGSDQDDETQKNPAAIAGNGKEQVLLDLFRNATPDMQDAMIETLKASQNKK